MGCVETNKEIRLPCLVIPKVLIKEASLDNTADSTERMLSPRDPQAENAIKMLNEINLIRSNPKAFSSKIIQVLNRLHCSGNKHTLVYDKEIQIELCKGKEAFESCIYNLDNRYKPTPPLKFREELCVPFPENVDLILDKAYISKEIEKKRKKMKGKYTIVDFQYDVSPNPIMSTLIQIVDDSSSFHQRRKNLLNKSAKYIGITCGYIRKEIICFYLLFAF